MLPHREEIDFGRGRWKSFLTSFIGSGVKGGPVIAQVNAPRRRQASNSRLEMEGPGLRGRHIGRLGGPGQLKIMKIMYIRYRQEIFKLECC